ncbi:hypothetical protein H310_03193 [Aphanomyces invadans]|uniref:Uncharacterized protein n=1 Tax=Aphanomyces invadans TaxID=157072 RepID=A0A024UIM2_9STRA|nr:hypothetical protein H310_03193 [Aphanomyces invadans]ETW05428.1 hypothetical protein H310_03193 [Aphanomyces invadans]|eukprot:XP_008865205.1 hypothetical protein H310_03193 [Aphanomyces invadans]
MPSLAVVPSTGTLQRGFDVNKAAKVRSRLKLTLTLVKRMAGILCASLLTIDVFANNWEIMNYVGNGRHFLTPLLDVDTVDALEARYSFPPMKSPNGVSKVGRYMIEFALAQLLDEDGAAYVLSMGSFAVHDASSNLCGSLVQTYPVIATAISKNNSIRVGTIKDGVTYIRGNTLTHWFGSTLTAPQAVPGTDDDDLRAMGYVPGRSYTDMRVTTPLPLSSPRQLIALNVSMYRFFSTSFCSGCHPYTELGIDVCSVVYWYNDTAKTVTLKTSDRIGGARHDLGIMFQRSWESTASLIVRIVCMVMLLGAFGASEKTVRWTEPSDVDTTLKRLMYLVNPAKYRHSSEAFEFAYLCFNSDVAVFLYTLAVLFDENLAIVFSQTLHRWAQQSNTNGWVELRLMAFSLRWLWFNCLLLKAAKWLCNYVSNSQYTGQNVVMGWLNFSSVTWIYLSYVVLAMRNTFIEYGNSVRLTIDSTAQNLDGTSVDFFDSWYIRAMGPLLIVMACNLALVLVLDRFCNRSWWRHMANNSLCRQYMYNSTSILCSDNLHFVPRRGFTGSSIEVRARMLCTMQWFLSSHVLRFGLQEQPQAVRNIVATKSTAVGGAGHRHHGQHGTVSGGGGRDSESSSVSSKRGSVTSRRHEEDKQQHWTSPMIDEDIRASSDSAADASASRDMHLIVQDRDGHVRMFDADKRELQALGLEIKILRDSTYLVA